MTIETTCTRTSGGLGRCCAGCKRLARWTLTARVDGVSATSFACDEHRPDREIYALRMLATALDRQLRETRAAA